jgi:ATP-binding cassette subfamily C protein CydC
MKTHKSRMAIATTLGVAALVGGLGLTISSAWLITMAAQHPPILVLSVSIVMVRFFGISRSAARYAERIVSHESVFRSLTALRVKLFERLADRTSLIVRDLNSGSYVKAIVDDVERAQEYQLRVTLPRYAAFISLAFGLLLAFWIYPTLLVILLPVTLALLLAIPSIVNKKCSVQSSAIEDIENRYAREISDANYGITEAQIYGYKDRLLKKIHGIEEEIESAEKKLLATVRSLQLLTLLLIGISIVGTSLLMYNSSANGDIPAVKISMAIFLPLVAFEGITNWYPNLFISGKLLRAQRSIDTLSNETGIQKANSSNIPTTFNLVIDSASAAWDKPFMSPVTAAAGPGEVLVIRGKSGSGKSTLALALVGLLPYQGSISIGEIQIRDIEDLHQYISASLQRGHIFNTSLRENLKIANPQASDTQIQRILTLLELDAIPLDEVVGEFGRPLSGGEAKRLGVARALLSNAPIVLLDEPTEHLDHKLAERLESRIIEECRDRSLIVITHSGWSKSTRTVAIARE